MNPIQEYRCTFRAVQRSGIARCTGTHAAGSRPQLTKAKGLSKCARQCLAVLPRSGLSSPVLTPDIN